MVIRNQHLLVRDWSLVRFMNADYNRRYRAVSRLNDPDMNELFQKAPPLVSSMSQIANQDREALRRVLAEHPQTEFEVEFLREYKQYQINRTVDEYRKFVDDYNNELRRIKNMIPEVPDKFS